MKYVHFPVSKYSLIVQSHRKGLPQITDLCSKRVQYLVELILADSVSVEMRSKNPISPDTPLTR